MKLWELRRAFGEYARSFDPARLSARDATRARDLASSIKHMAAAVEAQAAPGRRDQRLEEERRTLCRP